METEMCGAVPVAMCEANTQPLSQLSSQTIRRTVCVCVCVDVRACVCFSVYILSVTVEQMS